MTEEQRQNTVTVYRFHVRLICNENMKQFSCAVSELAWTRLQQTDGMDGEIYQRNNNSSCEILFSITGFVITGKALHIPTIFPTAIRTICIIMIV